MIFTNFIKNNFVGNIYILMIFKIKMNIIKIYFQLEIFGKLKTYGV